MRTWNRRWKRWPITLCMALVLPLILTVLISPASADEAPSRLKTNRGLFGTVLQVEISQNESAITIETDHGKVEVLAGQDAVVKVPGRKEASIVDIVTGASVAVYAVEEGDGFRALSILVKPDKPVTYRQVLGVVESVDDDVTIVDGQGNKSVLKKPENVQDLVPGKKVVAVVKVNASGQIVTTATVNQVVETPRSTAGALALKSPSRADIDEVVTLQVYDRYGTGRARGAQVYALGPSPHDLLPSLSVSSLAALARERGLLLGTTGDEGTVAHAFPKEGWYVIVAVMGDYLPGVARISVGPGDTLGIQVPYRVKMGDSFEMTVISKGSGNPVADVLVYLVPSAEVKAAAEIEDRSALEVAALKSGRLLGATDVNGMLKATVEMEGAYVLVAVKAGYRPGRSYLFVVPGNVLAIKCPSKVEPGSTVTLHVYERFDGTPVGDSAVYAYPGYISAIDVTAGAEPSPEQIAAAGGRLLGRTDDQGDLSYVAEQEGTYMVLAMKQGYAPARTLLDVSTVKALVMDAPEEAQIGEAVTFKVTEQGGTTAVEGAALYAMGVWEGGNANPAINLTPTSSITVGTSAVSMPDWLISDNGIRDRAAIAEASATEVYGAANRLGSFLGETDEDGEFAYAFERAGRYVVVAVKRGYKPGTANINVKGAAPSALAIRGPEKLQTGELAAFEVSDRGLGRPVEGAGVYAFPSYLRTIDLAFDGDPAAELLARWQGIFVGRTDASGGVTYSFPDAGSYLVVAVKKGYQPGVTRLIVVSPIEGKLGIKSPEEAQTGQEVVFAIYERASGEMVAEVAVYSFPAELPEVLDALVDEPTGAMLARWRGVFLGRTDANGQLIHTFSVAGPRIIVAIKKGYVPTAAKILIVGEGLKPLKVDGPDRVQVGNPATFNVTDGESGQAVESAGVYAFPAYLTAADMPFDGDLISEMLARWQGLFLGRTDANGEVTYQFEKAASYLVVAFKEGYKPARTRLLVYPEPIRTLGIKSRAESRVGDEVLFTVYEGDSGQVVSGAVVYAFPSNLPIATAAIGNEIGYDLLNKWGGVLLGRTDGDGQLTYAFRVAGPRIIVATKQGYVPAVTKLLVVGESTSALTIRGTESVQVGDPVSYQVSLRGTGQPFSDAGVYAFPSNLREADLAFDGDPSREALTRLKGIFLGRTDENGKIESSFAESGIYLVVAVKQGYVPGVAKTLVTPKVRQALAIKSAAEAAVGSGVMFGVYQQNGMSVPRAAVYAFPSDLPVALEAVMEGDVPQEFLNKWHGIFIGHTDGNGQVKYTFKDDGKCLVVGLKSGYLPGIGEIAIRPVASSQIGATPAGSVVSGS